uniref:Uncharacterized protein n=1 Tax=Anguilla anguilla TaxID=7936 RepID=A0A0E9W751_ANGAN
MLLSSNQYSFTVLPLLRAAKTVKSSFQS